MLTQRLPYKWDFRINRGIPFSLRVQWLNREKTPQINLADFDATLTLIGDNGRTLKFTSNPERGIILYPVTGEIEIEILGPTTKRLLKPKSTDVWGNYNLVLTAKDGSEGPYALLYGKVIILGV